MKSIENPFVFSNVQIAFESQKIKDNHTFADLDEYISFDFNAKDKSEMSPLSGVIEKLEDLNDKGIEVIIASSFHPDVVNRWVDENMLRGLVNETVLQVPRAADVGRRNPRTGDLDFGKPDSAINFIETPAMSQCPRPACDSKSTKNIDKAKIHIVNNEFENDLEKFYFTGHHRRTNRITSYFGPYDRHFSRFRGKDVSILEIGIANGGGLQMWKNYLGDKSRIYGIDIRPSCMFEESQITCFLGDQQDVKFLDSVMSKIGELDMVCDDGGHSMEQQINSFIKIWPYVKPGGVYLVEDLITSYHPNNKYGSENRDNSFISVVKNMIDEVNRPWVEKEYEGLFGCVGFPAAAEKASIHAYSSQVFIEKLPSLENRCKGWPGEVHQVGHAVSGLPGMKTCQLSCQDGTDETMMENIKNHVLKNCHIKSRK